MKKYLIIFYRLQRKCRALFKTAKIILLVTILFGEKKQNTRDGFDNFIVVEYNTTCHSPRAKNFATRLGSKYIIVLRERDIIYA